MVDPLVFGLLREVKQRQPEKFQLWETVLDRLASRGFSNVTVEELRMAIERLNRSNKYDVVGSTHPRNKSL